MIVDYYILMNKLKKCGITCSEGTVRPGKHINKTNRDHCNVMVTLRV